MHDVQPSLKAVLKRLKLSGLVPVLPDRAAYAAKAGLGPLDFLELTLQDEIDRREHKNLSNRLDRAGFSEPHTFEDFDWDAPVTFDRDRVRDLFSLSFLDKREDVLFLGPVGVGKAFLACALAHSACRAGHKALFLRSDHLLRMIHQSRADNSTERVIRSLLAPDVLVIDDFGLRRLNAQQSSDFYEVIIERHRRASTLVTSNRSIDLRFPRFSGHPRIEAREVSTCHEEGRRTRRSSGGGWWSWSGRAGARRAWARSSSRRPTRSGSGSSRPTWTRVFGPMG